MDNVKNLFFKSTYLLLVSVLLFSSCTKDDDESEKKTNYIKVVSLTQNTIKTLLTNFSQTELAALVKYDVDIYTYTYRVNYMGNSITASGVICVPISSGTDFPVLCYQHGTLVAHSEAPSIAYNYPQNMAVESMAGLGYVLVIPDEIGFGSSSDYLHPYLVKESNVMAVTEMLASIREIPKGDLSGSGFNDSLFLMGYSHGGWVTMGVAKELENSSTHNWKLIATASGAGPYYPEMVMNYAFSNKTYEKPFFFAYGMLSYIDNASISNSLTDFYKEPYASKIPNLFDGANSGTIIDDELSQINSELYTDNFLNNYPNGQFLQLQTALKNNETGAWKNSSPILLIHGENDTYIPKTVSDSIFNSFINMGSNNVELLTIQLTNHNTAAVPALSSSLLWFANYK